MGYGAMHQLPGAFNPALERMVQQSWKLCYIYKILTKTKFVYTIFNTINNYKIYYENMHSTKLTVTNFNI